MTLGLHSAPRVAARKQSNSIDLVPFALSPSKGHPCAGWFDKFTMNEREPLTLSPSKDGPMRNPQCRLRPVARSMKTGEHVTPNAVRSLRLGISGRPRFLADSGWCRNDIREPPLLGMPMLGAMTTVSRVTRVGHLSRTTVLRSTPMSLISISITSPSFMFSPAPSVPIHKTSPGYRVM